VNRVFIQEFFGLDEGPVEVTLLEGFLCLDKPQSS
jgi:hypothetical protein